MMGSVLIRATLCIDPDTLDDMEWAQAVFNAEAIEKYRAELIAARLVK